MQNSSTTRPENRGGATLDFTGEKNIYLIAGGAHRALGIFNDFWKLKLEVVDGKAAFGYKKMPKFDAFSHRSGHASCRVGNKIYIFGGENFHNSGYSNELWEFRIDN